MEEIDGNEAKEVRDREKLRVGKNAAGCTSSSSVRTESAYPPAMRARSCAAALHAVEPVSRGPC